MDNKYNILSFNHNFIYVECVNFYNNYFKIHHNFKF